MAGTGSKIVVVGAGLSGATVARIAADYKRHVLVIEQRSHVAGNCYDEWVDGVLVHRYGPHAFHTNAPEVKRFLSRFTEWTPYEHKVVARVQGHLLPLPFNRTAAQMVFSDTFVSAIDTVLNEDAVVRVDRLMESDEPVLKMLGHRVYDNVIAGYTQKQWGKKAESLSAEIWGRAPVRWNHDDRYHTDQFQALPTKGYTAMVQRMLDGIPVMLNQSFVDDVLREGDTLVWTGPVEDLLRAWSAEGKANIDLPYRSLVFHDVPESAAPEWHGDAAQVNEPSPLWSVTRYVDYGKFPNRAERYSLQPRMVSEVPYAWSPGLERFYPMMTEDARAQYRMLAETALMMAETRKIRLSLVGRLAQYRYYNMDQAVAAAQREARHLLAPEPSASRW